MIDLHAHVFAGSEGVGLAGGHTSIFPDDFALRAGTREGGLSAVAQLVRGLGTEGIGRWRRYHRQLEPVAALLEPWVKRFYYDP